MANDGNKKKYIKYEDTTYTLEDSRIPDPSSADNGKVLGIVNGAYVLKQEQGGGGEGTVKSVNNIEPDANGDVALGASDVHALPDSTVIPTVPQMATDPDMTDWTSGKTVDAATLATDMDLVSRALMAKYTKPSGGIPASDLASAVQTSLGKADTALQPDALQTELDDNVPLARFVLVMNGNTITTVDTYLSIAMSFMSTARRVMFVVVLAQSGGTVTTALELYPTMIDTNNRLMTLVGYFDGNRYSTTLTATSPSATMTGTIVVEPIKELPAVTASDNGKFLRVVSGAWAAATIPAAESNSFGGGS